MSLPQLLGHTTLLLVAVCCCLHFRGKVLDFNDNSNISVECRKNFPGEFQLAVLYNFPEFETLLKLKALSVLSQRLLSH